MNEAIGNVIALAVAVAVSPPPVIAMVLLLGTQRSRTSGGAFLLAWLAGLAAVGAIVLLVSAGAGATAESGDDPATWVSVLLVLLGLALIAYAAKQWRGRPRAGETVEPPKWMVAIDAFTPRKALAAGALLAAGNPKNLLLTVAAAAEIAETGLGGGEEAIAMAVFAAVGSFGVAAPFALRVMLGDRSRGPLDDLRSWMAANNAGIMAAVALVIGANVLGDGIAGF